jgi:hypothetical protein
MDKIEMKQIEQIYRIVAEEMIRHYNNNYLDEINKLQRILDNYGILIGKHDAKIEILLDEVINKKVNTKKGNKMKDVNKKQEDKKQNGSK